MTGILQILYLKVQTGQRESSNIVSLISRLPDPSYLLLDT